MSHSRKPGLMLAAPASGSGKTILTLSVLRAFRNRGISVGAAKAGPDYIDPGFQAFASGNPSVNLDPWAMTPERILSLFTYAPGSHVLVEAMMGLFDGAADGSGSAADLAKMLQIPVVLVVDAAKQSHSAAALVRGFRDHDPDIRLSGVIFNKVGSPRHELLLREAMEPLEMPVLGAIRRDNALVLPERHLGLVQSCDMPELETLVSNAANVVANQIDLDMLISLFDDAAVPGQKRLHLPPLGQHIAVASDEAFSFIYSHLLEDWRNQGAEISLFSPLRGEAPNGSADAVYLPGGYPELHAEKISHASVFFEGLKSARERDAVIYGECGGYMVLGDGLTDKDGRKHRMAGLLRLETSFEHRKLHLGYRAMNCENFGLGSDLKGHEFHYTSALKEKGDPLFAVRDARGTDLGASGLRDGKVMGSYIHVIDRSGT